MTALKNFVDPDGITHRIVHTRSDGWGQPVCVWKKPFIHSQRTKPIEANTNQGITCLNCLGQ